MSLIKINQLTAANEISGFEQFPLWQDSQTVQTSLSNIQSPKGTNNFSYDSSGYGNSGIFGGLDNTLSARRSAIFGSQYSEIKGAGAFNPIASIIGGGSTNKICCAGFQSAIIAGQGSCIYMSTIGGIVASSNSIISGGTTTTSRNFIAGGSSHKVIGDPTVASNNPQCNVILGGTLSQAYGISNVIIGAGRGKTGLDTITCGSYFYGRYSMVIGGGDLGGIFGSCNQARSNFSTVLNGTANCAVAMGSTIIGGCNNNILSHGTGCLLQVQEGGTIIGGNNNLINTGHKNSSIIGGSCMNSVSSNMLHTQTLYLSADMLPTSDPGVRGVVWNDSGALKISL